MSNCTRCIHELRNRGSEPYVWRDTECNRPSTEAIDQSPAEQGAPLANGRRISLQGSCMSSHHLATYLNDHLAGAVAGVEMLEHIAEKRSGLVDTETLLRIKRDVEEDRGTLEAL